jgi:hypothetical protein
MRARTRDEEDVGVLPGELDEPRADSGDEDRGGRSCANRADGSSPANAARRSSRMRSKSCARPPAPTSGSSSSCRFPRPSPISSRPSLSRSSVASSCSSIDGCLRAGLTTYGENRMRDVTAAAAASAANGACTIGLSPARRTS